ncbi:unnamed protein product, partial [Phaeothamnion confervicola]
AASAQQTLLATAVGPAYDDVANCLMKQMAPRLAAVPVVRPPPTNKAEVHLYPAGSERMGTPVASFFVSQEDGGRIAILFEERPDQRGQHTVTATAAAARCAR